jgi:hypothetical protein
MYINGELPTAELPVAQLPKKLFTVMTGETIDIIRHWLEKPIVFR